MDLSLTKIIISKDLHLPRRPRLAWPIDAMMVSPLQFELSAAVPATYAKFTLLPRVSKTNAVCCDQIKHASVRLDL